MQNTVPNTIFKGFAKYTFIRDACQTVYRYTLNFKPSDKKTETYKIEPKDGQPFHINVSYRNKSVLVEVVNPPKKPVPDITFTGFTSYTGIEAVCIPIWRYTQSYKRHEKYKHTSYVYPKGWYPFEVKIYYTKNGINVDFLEHFRG